MVKFRNMKRLIVLTLDIFGLYFSLYLTLIIRYSSGFGDKIGIHLIPFSILFLLWIIVFYISNLYELIYFKNDFHYYSRFFQAITLSAGLSIAFFYLIPFFGITPKTNLFIIYHCSKFYNIKLFFISAHSFLSVKYRTPRVNFYYQSNKRK